MVVVLLLLLLLILPQQVPFNFPVMVPMWTLPIAIGMGNCMILKPSEKVPMTVTLKIAELLAEVRLLLPLLLVLVLLVLLLLVLLVLLLLLVVLLPLLVLVLPLRLQLLLLLSLLLRLLQAGVPPGVVNIVNGAVDTVTALCDHPRIAAISFVGSSKVQQIT